MDWFLYDIELLHERVKMENGAKNWLTFDFLHLLYPILIFRAADTIKAQAYSHLSL